MHIDQGTLNQSNLQKLNIPPGIPLSFDFVECDGSIKSLGAPTGGPNSGAKHDGGATGTADANKAVVEVGALNALNRNLGVTGTFLEESS